ncbi:Cytochrome b561, putative [Pediculus humanus corporis]|uniref:Cytochrome b561, putative n=1 Tax=Pediculus humanus subsp. corporis TaxID=121224 RepID=E0VVT2_PEDHC|nr:Cytochrome b561, putative [Pediculus humanus corporis]EEB17488.1 Cytochrome b561, putative [Pediculus humanus corporis]
MDTNMVSPMPEVAPMAEFDKSPPTTAHSIGNSPKKQSQYENDDWGCGNWCEYMMVITLASVLLVGSITLVLFWALYYRGGFAWQENPKKQFNLHPVLMMMMMATTILLYRICRCCRKIYVKLFHALFHALAIPCIVVGFLAVWDFHNLGQPPIPNFYSLHSWLGLVTCGLFILQFVVGTFSFLILLCCEGATAAFRASLTPVHSSFGITTFMLAVATCLTGFTQKTLITFGETYQNWPEEGIILNAMGMCLIGLGILLSYVVRRDSLRFNYKYNESENL